MPECATDTRYHGDTDSERSPVTLLSQMMTSAPELVQVSRPPQRAHLHRNSHAPTPPVRLVMIIISRTVVNLLDNKSTANPQQIEPVEFEHEWTDLSRATATPASMGPRSKNVRSRPYRPRHTVTTRPIFLSLRLMRTPVNPILQSAFKTDTRKAQRRA